MSREIDLAKKLFELQDDKSRHEEALKDIRGKIKETTDELIETLVEEGKNSTGHISGIGNFTIARSIYPSIPAYQLPTFIDKIRGTPDFEMVKETIPAPTLKAYLKDKIHRAMEAFIEAPETIEVEFPGESLTAEEASKKHFEKIGVRYFEELKLQHRGRGKA